MRYLNTEAIKTAALSYKGAQPFNHCVVENFLLPSVARQLETEFLEYDDPRWFVYDNPVENKKACNEWNAFPPLTYSVFSELCSPEVCAFISDITGEHLYPDYGLHGGGMHIHGEGGNLNPHLDYFTHPKLTLKRKVNIIIYFSNLDTGLLGLWAESDGNAPGDLVKEVAPRFNRAIIFDTENSWHGMACPMSEMPKGIYRKSLAMYYLTDSRKRALYAPRPEQKADAVVNEFIKHRAET